MEKPTEHSESANSSGPSFMPRPPLTVQAVTLTLVPLVCAVGVAGNAMVVLVVVRSRHMVTQRKTDAHWPRSEAARQESQCFSRQKNEPPGRHN